MSIDCLSPTELVLSIANRQYGVVGRQQLLDADIEPGFIQGRINARHFTAVYPGVYAVGHSQLPVRGHWMAAVLASGPASVLSHRSAASNWGLVPPPPVIEVLRSSSPKESAPLYAGHPTPFGRRIVIHRSRVFGPDEYELRNGIPTTTVPRTLLNLAATWNVRQLDSALSEAERFGLVELKLLKEISHRGRGWTGIRKLREVVDAWDPSSIRTRSELEMEFLRLCREYRIPAPEINVMVGGHEVDCLWSERKLIVELDGHRYHRAPDVFERDKERTAALEDAGYQVLRLTYRMVTEERRKTAERVKRRLARTFWVESQTK
ncbi:MAG TPA: DUF559 domain-containing protein [Solirubrobacterales bacterium]|nr:DUF559 domain-containing protein [Solirubrobacterales bacterium]